MPKGQECDGKDPPVVIRHHQYTGQDDNRDG
jgi:hypothetical protein